MSKYWDKAGTYQAEFDELTGTLMPLSGPCDTFAGELVRAVNRLYYDAFNNGFCNNTSGAFNFLEKNLTVLGPDTQVQDALQTIQPCTNTGGYSTVTPAVGVALDVLVGAVVEMIQNNPGLKSVAPPCDMFAMQDKDEVMLDDDDDDGACWYQ